jgi:arylsulfatase A-like enzyme
VAATARTAPVVIAIVVDQFAAWVADARLDKLPSDGGFARLRREGTYVRELRFAHAVTDTAPGHASLHTGAPPRVHGIVANEIVDPDRGTVTSVVRDPDVRRITFRGVDDAPSASPRALEADTVASRLSAVHPDARIVSLSLKDRSAVLPLGKARGLALWFDAKIDAFVTSTAYATAMPRWAAPAVGPDALAELRATPWALGPESGAWVAEHARTPDDQPGEGDVRGFGRVFPHAIANAAEPAYAFRASPFGDAALFALAEAALDDARTADVPIFLSVSLSSNDYIGHVFGPDSWEAWAELFELDRKLARFLAALDERFGAGGYAVVLSADHGTTSMPEVLLGVPAARAHCTPKAKNRFARPCTGPSVRIDGEALTAALKTKVARAGFAPETIAGIVDPYLRFGSATAALSASERARLAAILIRELTAVPGMARVIDVSKIGAACPPGDSVDALVCRSVFPGRGGDLYLVTKPGSFFDPHIVTGFGTSHGSPYLYDRTVPMFVRAPGRVSAGVTIDTPTSFEAFARTLASLLGIDPPEAARAGHDLTQHGSATAWVPFAPSPT